MSKKGAQQLLALELPWAQPLNVIGISSGPEVITAISGLRAVCEKEVA